MHRDVKPDNILVEEIAGASLELASIILIDFNVAKNTGNNSSDMVTWAVNKYSVVVATKRFSLLVLWKAPSQLYRIRMLKLDT